MKHTRWSTLSVVFALVVGLGLGSLSVGIADSVSGAQPSAAPMPATTGSFARLAEAVKPAVINVNIERRPTDRGRTPLEEFFGRSVPSPAPRRSLGSGVIIDPSGVALTNAHVVGQATEVEVVTVDGRKHAARVVGVDTKTDLAVLRLADGKGSFPFLPLGDSDGTEVGDWVLAVGSPFGLQATVTSGIVSAKARHIGAGPYDDFLQTDAAINPGNSGGPLVNMRGEVIGINTAIVRGGSGIGFAIPASMAKRISAELLATGKVTRGWLGVSLQPLTPELAASFGVEAKGALINDVVPDSPAARAGLEPGDVIVKIDGQPVADASAVVRSIGFGDPGKAVTVTVWRDGREQSVRVTLAEAPGERQATRLGLEVRPVTPELARELNLGTREGVIVARVEDGSPADRAGIRRGDLIREIDRAPVRSLADFERLTADAGTRPPLTMRLQRGGGSLYVALPSTTG